MEATGDTDKGHFLLWNNKSKILFGVVGLGEEMRKWRQPVQTILSGNFALKKPVSWGDTRRGKVKSREVPL